MYADTMTQSMEKAIKETERRRTIQEKYNKENNITPTTIKKEIRDAIHSKETHEMMVEYLGKKMKKKSKDERNQLVASLEKEMKEAARVLDFERAAELRDMILEIKSKDE